MIMFYGYSDMKKVLMHPARLLYHFLQQTDAGFRMLLVRFFYPLFLKIRSKEIENLESLPVFVISYNRLKYVRQTIRWLEERGHQNIIIIDNNSNYKPLLNYLEQINYKTFRLRSNWGHEVFFKNPRFFFMRNFHFFALTDPDVCPISECYNDYMEKFINILNGEETLTKVGFSLKIDDLPDAYSLKDKVIEWEKHFYENGHYVDGVVQYKANIDTTFAVYRPKIFWAYKNRFCAVRVGYPYQLRHLPWYNIERDNEDEYYCGTIRPDITNWNGNVSEKDLEKRLTR